MEHQKHIVSNEENLREKAREIIKERLGIFLTQAPVPWFDRETHYELAEIYSKLGTQIDHRLAGQIYRGLANTLKSGEKSNGLDRICLMIMSAKSETKGGRYIIAAQTYQEAIDFCKEDGKADLIPELRRKKKETQERFPEGLHPMYYEDSFAER